MTVADASVAVAAFAGWHEHHDQAASALDPGAAIVGHAALEAYSVLTRLPEPFLVEGPVVAEFLRRRFADRHLLLTGAQQRAVVEQLSQAGILGGAVYDGLIALTAAATDATLLTLDRRALATYRACGARVALIT